MLAWKMLAMLLVGLGVLLDNVRLVREIKKRFGAIGAWWGPKKLENLAYEFLPLSVAGYFAFSFLPGRTVVGPWLAGSEWYKVLLSVLGIWGLLQSLDPFTGFRKLRAAGKRARAAAHIVAAEFLYLLPALLLALPWGARPGLEFAMFLAGGTLLSGLARAFAWAVVKLLGSEEAITATSMLLVAAASAIQIFVLAD